MWRVKGFVNRHLRIRLLAVLGVTKEISIGNLRAGMGKLPLKRNLVTVPITFRQGMGEL